MGKADSDATVRGEQPMTTRPCGIGILQPVAFHNERLRMQTSKADREWRGYLLSSTDASTRL